MKFTLDIKTWLIIGGVIATLGGFYYSTQYRLDALEDKIDELSEKINVQSGELKQVRKQLKRVHKKNKNNTSN